MLGKLRPVGSRVPKPEFPGELELPWQTLYQTYLMGSGTEALSAAVAISIGRKPDVTAPEVILPAYGCPDLIAATVAQSAKPVLVDLEPGRPFMSAVGVKSALTESTVAVVGVGFLGIPERLERLAEICVESNLTLIEDSAQCFPPASSVQGWADLVVLSFGRGKPINLMGGGALLASNANLGNVASTLSQYPLKNQKLGLAWRSMRILFNFLMSRIPFAIIERIPQFAIGETRFHTLDEIFRLEIPSCLLSSGIGDFNLRAPLTFLYNQKLEELESRGWTLLAKHLVNDSGMDQALLRYPLLAPDRLIRDRALERLNGAGIGASAFYEHSLEEIDGIDEILPESECPVAKDFAARLLTLPTHEDVRDGDVSTMARELFRL
ncbi:dTDP-4-amino-4,6-dideoxygalactose transaminase [Marinobacter sp. 3-2]|jgi:dTDP-4-amino-4,6-dideoxygalactose transaminase|uniref:DegT/DnrJ/EryC1/StrS family aminotransferase n=1 Tax=Marinobacter sp. 3-2 TaxID=2485141 RepID=UPI000D394CF1|nr:DegT/DnrJ/EryC1/StrS family aminotransferase [Marinobacter sp. 3-2]ROQ42894.1 dTDP-4-amino-4,6-dideoxygalactose transaminase [Marinobacter sp. 3-2]